MRLCFLQRLLQSLESRSQRQASVDKEGTVLRVTLFPQIYGMALFEKLVQYYRNSQMCIFTGCPNIAIAIKLIKRMKSLFQQKLGLTFPNKEKY
jgi:ActR/RegA family two-component response regulator